MREGNHEFTSDDIKTTTLPVRRELRCFTCDEMYAAVSGCPTCGEGNEPGPTDDDVSADIAYWSRRDYDEDQADLRYLRDYEGR